MERALQYSLLLALLSLFSPASAVAKPANILLVLMDNFGYGEIGVYGGGAMRGAPTPRIDSIAADGLRLTNFNVEAECTPSRSALLTGRYGIRTRQRPDLPPRGVWSGINANRVTSQMIIPTFNVLENGISTITSYRIYRPTSTLGETSHF